LRAARAGEVQGPRGDGAREAERVTKSLGVAYSGTAGPILLLGGGSRNFTVKGFQAKLPSAGHVRQRPGRHDARRPAINRGNQMSTPPPSSQAAELENSRLGVIYFLGNLQVDFSPEASAKEMKDKALALLKGKVGDGKVMAAAGKVGAVVDGIDKKVDEIAKSIQQWLEQRFKVPASDAELAVQHVRYNLPSLIFGIQSAARGTGSFDASGALDIARGLSTAITRTIDYIDLQYKGRGVVLEAGHPDIVAQSIKSSIGKSALVGLAEAALVGAKAALAAFTSGVGVIINKVAGVIEALLRFAVRFCDALALRKVFADAHQKWSCCKQPDAIQKSAGEFSDWFKRAVDHAAVVAALVMNCGIAGDAMRFLQVVTGDGAVITQGQFDKGITYLNGLKSSAADLIQDVQANMRISSTDKMTASLLKHAGEIGYVQREASSSWRARIFGWSNQESTKSKALNWLLGKAGYKQSTVLRRV
jgi:hypothetical protein